MALLTGAAGYHRAAELLLKHGLHDEAVGVYWFAFHQNICLFVELCLKAYLTTRGYKESQLKKLSHDLQKTLAHCVDKKLEIGAECSNLIHKLSPLYKENVFRYLRWQEESFPEECFTLRTINELKLAVGRQIPIATLDVE